MDLPERKRNRAECYDYSRQGVYFVTICTNNREELFMMDEFAGKEEPAVSNQIVRKWLKETCRKYPSLQVEKYVIMPDHIHVLVAIRCDMPKDTLADAMHFFKTMTTNEYIREVKKGRAKPFHQKLWQKSYYDHIVRNQQDYNAVWEYIENNPLKWRIKHGME